MTVGITVLNGRTDTVIWAPGVGEVIKLLPMCSNSEILSLVLAGITATVKMQMRLSPGSLLLFLDLSLCSGNTDSLVSLLCYLIMLYNETF